MNDLPTNESIEQNSDERALSEQDDAPELIAVSEQQEASGHDETVVAAPSLAEPTTAKTGPVAPTPFSLLLSTALSLIVVLTLLVVLRFFLPSMLELSRYSWHRGQLRAEYEVSGQQLERVSWEGLTSVSQTVARRVSPSVVHITLANSTDSDAVDPDAMEELARAGLPLPRRMPTGQGSGVIIDEQGYILTNYHVIEDGGSVQVYLADDRMYVADIIGADRMTDLAVIKIEADDLLPAAWGNSDDAEIGSPVWAVGSPFGLTGSISFGILSSKHRLDLSGTRYNDSRRLIPRYSDLMQSDVAVNPGNSGGPLVNGRGEIIGINTAIIGEWYRGVSFSIPSNIAKNVCEQIISTGRVQRGWLGVELVRVASNESDSASAKPKGALVRNVVVESPAAVAGVSVGDVIVTMDGQSFKNVNELIHRIGKLNAGTAIKLQILRGGTPIELEVVVGDRPAGLR